MKLSIEKMTTSDKLRALEEIWESLQDAPEEVPSPGWHADVLNARENRVRSGASQFCDWPAAKRRIREQTQ